jgi:Protein of unknown function (DUF3866)
VPSFRRGRVSRLVSHRPGLQRVEVDGEPAYVLVQLTGPVSLGDAVIVNTTAVELGLGTGGDHVVHWNLERDHWRAGGGGHLMKLRYTSLQADTGSWSEQLDEPGQPPAPAVATAQPLDDAMPEPPPDLAGLVVVVGSLHSLLAPLAAAVAAVAPAAQVAWIMDDSAALPASLSDLAQRLRAAGLVHLIVTCGQAFGGDLEAVSVPDGLAAVATGGLEVALVVPGPGLAGTATTLGFGSVAAAGHADVAAALGAPTAVAVRASRVDPRARHRGVSHHTATVLALAARPHEVPVPQGPVGDELAVLLGDVAPHRLVRVATPDVTPVIGAAPLAVTSMGRPLASDDLAVGAAAAAGAWAGTLANA